MQKFRNLDYFNRICIKYPLIRKVGEACLFTSRENGLHAKVWIQVSKVPPPHLSLICSVSLTESLTFIVRLWHLAYEENPVCLAPSLPIQYLGRITPFRGGYLKYPIYWAGSCFKSGPSACRCLKLANRKCWAVFGIRCPTNVWRAVPPDSQSMFLKASTYAFFFKEMNRIQLFSLKHSSERRWC